MEVVIKLDDKDYEALNKVGHNGLEFNDTLEGRVYRAVANGTPLISADKSSEISIDNIPMPKYQNNWFNEQLEDLKAGGWFSVTEKLPPHSGYYYVITDLEESKPSAIWWAEDNYGNKGFCYQYTVRFWRPMKTKHPCNGCKTSLCDGCKNERLRQ